MARPSSSSGSAAGGVLLAGGAMAGTAGGLYYGQPTIGFLIGGGVGVVLALLVWWRDRRA